MALCYIKVYYDLLEALANLSDSERGRLLTAMLQHARQEDVTPLAGGEKYLWPMVRAQIDRERAAYQKLSQERSRAGALGGRPRKEEEGTSPPQEKSNCFPGKQGEASPGKKSQDQDQEKEKDKNQEKEKDQAQNKDPEPSPPREAGPLGPPPLAPCGGGADAYGFEAFWQAYPKKVGKEAARKLYLRLRPGKALRETMLAAIRGQRASEQWQRNAGQFIPNPATWLQQGRWQDDVAALGAAAPGGSGFGSGGFSSGSGGYTAPQPARKTVPEQCYTQREYPAEAAFAPTPEEIEEALRL